jgi:hypothetical protein
MNIENTKEAIKVMQAYVNGKTIESYSTLYLEWRVAPSPSWNFAEKRFRIKPTDTLRPWTADEVPLGAWIRYKENNQSIRMMIVCNRENGLCGYGTDFPYDYLRDEMEHSTDGGKTWHPCGVMEEAK